MAGRKFTRKRRRTFLDKLAASGNISAAAAAAGLSRSRLYELRETDPEFALQWEDAEFRFLDSAANEEARRALVGDERVTIRETTKQYKDGTIVTERVEERTKVKSDRLLAHLLDRRHPEFRRAAARRELTGEGGGPIKFDGVEFVVVDPAAPAPPPDKAGAAAGRK